LPLALPPQEECDVLSLVLAQYEAWKSHGTHHGWTDSSPEMILPLFPKQNGRYDFLRLTFLVEMGAYIDDADYDLENLRTPIQPINSSNLYGIFFRIHHVRQLSCHLVPLIVSITVFVAHRFMHLHYDIQYYMFRT
jgi:hypothetical protein